MLYFTADTHFNHSNIINLCGRPFTNVEQMNNLLIQNWNSCIKDDDEIYILGDFVFKGNGIEVNNTEINFHSWPAKTEIIFWESNRQSNISLDRGSFDFDLSL